MISEHASPIDPQGGVDSGGQNVYVGQLSTSLAKRGWLVDIFTRRASDKAPEVVEWRPGVRVINVPAGPAAFVRKEEMLPHMAAFAAWMRERWWTHGPYDMVHANFWMSGLVASELKAAYDVPYAVTFHALGRVRRLFQGEADEFPDERFAIEEDVIRNAAAVIAECPQDRDDLIELYGASGSRIEVIPCGVDSDGLRPVDKGEARRAIGICNDRPVILQLGRMVPRKGIDNVVEALALLRQDHGVDAQLLVVW